LHKAGEIRMSDGIIRLLQRNWKCVRRLLCRVAGSGVLMVNSTTVTMVKMWENPIK